MQNYAKNFRAIFIITCLTTFHTACHQAQDDSGMCREIPIAEEPAHPLTGGILMEYRWPFPNGQPKVIWVYFLNDEPEVIKKVMAKANEWRPYSGIEFKLAGPADPYQVTIRLGGEENLSYIGRTCNGKATAVQLANLKPSTPDSIYSRVVLHEFGHVLGLVHEHSLPGGNPIRWNRDAVLKHYTSSKIKWSPEQVETNIFRRYAANQLNGGSQFDPSSIMIYAIPEKYLESGKPVKWNYKLSDQDKRIVASVYASD